MKKCRGRNHTRESCCRIVSIGGGETPLKPTEVYNIYNEPFMSFPDLPEGRDTGCAVKVGDSVYFIGGNKAGAYPPSKIVWSLNLKDKMLQWKEEASLNCARIVMGAAAYLHQDVVVVGGTDGNRGDNHFSSCEAYSSSSHVWKNIPALNQSRSGHAVVSCQDCLYALGGYNNCDGYLSSVERMIFYEKWEDVKPMQTTRRWFAAVSCNDVVYAMGGQGGIETDTTQKSVEKFDPAVNEWTFVSDMNFARHAFSACVIQGKIFVVGGLNEENESVREIECYNPLIDKWSIVGKTDATFFNHSLVVI